MTTSTLEAGSPAAKFKKRAMTPKGPPKRPYWRDDVITVVNKYLGYPFVHPDDQAWFWTEPWQESVQRSVEEINAGAGRQMSDAEFLAALGS
jgi:hypothetical protein